MLCCCDYAESVVAIFVHQMQYEYYSRNIFVSIEGIALENFSALPQTGIEVSTKSCTRHAVFNYYFPDYSKHDASNNTTHSKILIELKKIIDVRIEYNMGKY